MKKEYNIEDINSPRGLNLAISQNDKATVESILQSGIDPNVANNKRYPLFEALEELWLKKELKKDYEEIIKILLNYGANPNTARPPSKTYGDHEESVLHEAINWNCSYAVIKLMLEKGGEPNHLNSYEGTDWRYKSRTTPFMAAVIRGDVDIINLCLAYGADINIKNQMGRPPIFYACSLQNLNILSFLISKNANINDTVNNDNFSTLLINECKKCRSLETIKFLLANDADPNIPDITGATPLTLAARCNAKAVKLLLAYNAKINTQDGNGNTALIHAVKMKNEDIL